MPPPQHDPEERKNATAAVHMKEEFNSPKIGSKSSKNKDPACELRAVVTSPQPSPQSALPHPSSESASTWNLQGRNPQGREAFKQRLQQQKKNAEEKRGNSSSPPHGPQITLNSLAAVTVGNSSQNTKIAAPVASPEPEVIHSNDPVTPDSPYFLPNGLNIGGVASESLQDKLNVTCTKKRVRFEEKEDKAQPSSMRQASVPDQQPQENYAVSKTTSGLYPSVPKIPLLNRVDISNPKNSLGSPISSPVGLSPSKSGVTVTQNSPNTSEMNRNQSPTKRGQNTEALPSPTGPKPDSPTRTFYTRYKEKSYPITTRSMDQSELLQKLQEAHNLKENSFHYRIEAGIILIYDQKEQQYINFEVQKKNFSALASPANKSAENFGTHPTMLPYFIDVTISGSAFIYHHKPYDFFIRKATQPGDFTIVFCDDDRKMNKIRVTMGGTRQTWLIPGQENNALEFACMEDLVEALINVKILGCPITLCDSSSFVSLDLHHGASPDQRLISLMLLGEYELALQFLRKDSMRSINVNSSEASYGHAPLHLAILGRQVELTKYLIEKGADQNQPNKLGRTPRAYAALCPVEKIQKLLNVAPSSDVSRTNLFGVKEIFDFVVKAINLKKENPIFGTPLQQVLKMQNSNDPIPDVVRFCMRKIAAQSTSEGIFRVSGSYLLNQKLQAAVDARKRYDQPPFTEAGVNEYGSLLKAFVRQLPGGLLPISFTQKKFSSIKSQDDFVKHFLPELQRVMPPDSCQYILLKELMCFFKNDIVANASQNSMTENALATCTAISFFPPYTPDARPQIKVVAILIRYADFL